MKKGLLIWFGVVITLVSIIVILHESTSEKKNWSLSFREKGTNPYDLKVFYEQLPHIASVESVQQANITPYEKLSGTGADTIGLSVYLFIEREINIDPVSVDALLEYASKGNMVLMSAYSFPNKLLDSLRIQVNTSELGANNTLKFVNKQFQNDTLEVVKALIPHSFEGFDKKETIVIGIQGVVDSSLVNFIFVKYGLGGFYLHTQPIVFTNFYLLKKPHFKYAEIVLSYVLNSQDNYNIKRNGKSQSSCTVFVDNPFSRQRKEEQNSPLRYILSQPALKWAFYLILAALLLFILFNAKRRQRIVPVVKPLENTTLLFINTLGNLYFEAKDVNNIIQKKITYFLAHLRSVYMLNTIKLDKQFVTLLVAKSGKSKDEIVKLVALINELKRGRNSSEAALERLNSAIEQFFKKT